MQTRWPLMVTDASVVTSPRTKLFLSAWGEDNEEFEAALLMYQKVHNISDDFAVWVCTFAMVMLPSV